MRNIFDKIANYKKDGIPCVVITTIEMEGSGPSIIGGKMIVANDNEPIGTIGGGALELLVIKEAENCFNKQMSYTKTYDLSNEETTHIKTGMICGGSVTLFFDYVSGGIPLYIFGAGHCGRAIVNRGKELGYYINILDSRDDMLESFVGGDKKVKIDYSNLENLSIIPNDSYIIVATPSHSSDYSVLKAILNLKAKPKYVGVLGSTKKVVKFKESLSQDLGRDIDYTNVYMPCGLDTGGRTPVDIAISIISEIQAIRYERTGNKHLRTI